MGTRSSLDADFSGGGGSVALFSMGTKGAADGTASLDRFVDGLLASDMARFIAVIVPRAV